MRQQVEDWHPAGIQVTGEKKLKIESRRRQQKHGVLLRCLYLYLCLMGTILTLRLDLGLKFRILPVAGVLLLFALVAILRNIWKPWGRKVYAGAYLVLFLSGVLGWKHLAAGWQVLENGIRHQISVYYGVTLAEKTQLLTGARGEFLLIIIFALFFWSMETAVVRKGRAGLLIASEILIILLELLCGCRFLQPGIFLIGGSLLALIAMGQNRGVSNQRILYRSGLWAGVLILSLALLAGLIGPVLAKQTKSWNEWLYLNVQKKTRQISRAMESQNGLFGNHNPTADGSLNNYPVDQKNEIDLTVHTSGKPAHNMYLRGFTGGTYQGNYWSGVEQKKFADAFSEADSGWQVQNILYRYIRSRSAEEQGSVTVTRENPGGDYGYIPYGCQVPDDENVQADGCYASAEKTITYQGYVNWTEWMDPQPSKDAESEIEGSYREYVAKEYLKVPVEGLDRLRSYCEKQNLQSVQEVIDFVVRDVQEGRTYSMDLEEVPADRDFAEYFFFDQKKGYCIHYATTATLMFRLLGVPARYVTGYVVAPQDFTEDGDGYTAKIPDTQAHAWVEVYRSGKGWIPVEVTPGYQENTGGNENQEVPGEESTPTPESTAEQTQEATPELTETPQPEQGETAATPQSENGQGAAGAETNTDNPSGGSGLARIGCALLKIFVLLLILVGLAGGSAGVVALHRKRILQERNRRFFQKNINRGICEISYAIYQILQDAKEAGVLQEIPEQNNDREFARQTEKNLSWMEEGAYTAVVELVERASFGPDPLTKQERAQCYQFYESLEQQFWAQMPRQKRFWWKYMKAYKVS